MTLRVDLEHAARSADLEELQQIGQPEDVQLPGDRAGGLAGASRSFADGGAGAAQLFGQSELEHRGAKRCLDARLARVERLGSSERVPRAFEIAERAKRHAE